MIKKETTSLQISPLKIKEVVLAPTVTQIANIPIGTIPFNISCVRGKIILCLICDETETVTEELRIDINSYNQPITFATTAIHMGTFEFPHPKGGYAILHAFATMKSKSLLIPSMTRSLHDLVKGLKA